MFKRAGKGFKRPYCINESCSNFLPEEKRGYPKKPAEKAEEAGEETAAEEQKEKKTAAKKATAKKAAEKKEETAE
jgi:DNA topoisomerase-1